MRNNSKLKPGVVLVVCLFVLLMCMLQHSPDGSKAIVNKMNYTLSAAHRKLLGHSMLEIDETCSRGDILVNQAPSATLPSGIPAFTVNIMNQCGSGCKISDIHVECGWFSSDQLISPKIFKRLGYNDCLVNDGKPLLHGATLTFTYANTFPYPLSVSSVSCP